MNVISIHGFVKPKIIKLVYTVSSQHLALYSKIGFTESQDSMSEWSDNLVVRIVCLSGVTI